MLQKNQLMVTCAMSALLAMVGAAAAGSAAAAQSPPTTNASASQTTPETADQAARAKATSQNTEAAGATAVGEVVVTATSRKVALQSLPVSASAYTDERRNLVGIETASDLVNFTPSMSLNGQFLSLRGVGRYTNTLGTDPGVAIFVDGVYTRSPDYLNQPDFFSDRIEILRGPQGTLGGENDIGGSVNVVSKRPTNEFHEEVRVGVNNYRYHYVDASISGPIIDHFRFRLTDAYAKQPASYGFFTNLDSPTHPGAGWSNLFEAQLDWKPTDNFSLWLRVQNFANNNAADAGVGRDQYTPFPQNTPFGGFVNCPTINGKDYQCLVPNPTDLLPPTSNPQINNLRVVNYNTVGYNKIKDDWTYTLQANYELPFATLEYIGGYSKYDFLYLSDADTTPSGPFRGLPAGYLSQVTTGFQVEKFWQNEVQLKSSGNGPLKWIVGAFQFYDHNYAPYNIEEPNNPSLDFPTGGAPNPSRAFYSQIGNFTDKVEAIYGNLDYSLTDTVRLTGGLRYNWDSKRGDVIYRQVFDTAGVFGIPTLNSSEVGVVTQGTTVKSSDWTGKIGAEWQPDPTTLVYGSVTKGYKSAGLSLLNVSPIPTVGPETLYDFEGGVKKRFGRKLLINADVYYYDYHNLQQFLSVEDVSTGLITSELVSAQRARTYGFELESTWSPTADFQLTFNYSYLNARFTRFSLPGGPILDFSQLAPGCVGTGTAGPPGTPGQCLAVPHANLNGSTIPQSPQNKVTINPVYTFHLPIGKLTFSATYAFNDKQYYAVFNNSNFLAPSYYNLDLRMLYQPPQGHFTLILYARNVTNRTQIIGQTAGSFVQGPANLITAPSDFPSHGGISYGINPPRVYGIELQAKF